MKFSESGKYWLMFFVTTLGLAIPAAQFFTGPKNKELSYEVSSTAVPSDSPESGIALCLGDRKFDEIGIQTIRIFNSGGIPIRRDDFDDALKVSYGKPVEILNVSIGKSSLKDLSAQYKLDGQEIRVTPLLLNPDDQITIKVRTAGAANPEHISARVAGISELKKFFPADNKVAKQDIVYAICSAVLFVAIGFCFYTAKVLSENNVITPRQRLAFLFFGSGVFEVPSLFLAKESAVFTYLSDWQAVTVLMGFAGMGFFMASKFYKTKQATA